jgi:hypothetical protein
MGWPFLRVKNRRVNLETCEAKRVRKRKKRGRRRRERERHTVSTARQL